MTGGPGHSAADLRWDRFGLVEQPAHVGSEGDRAILAQRAGHAVRFENAFEHALTLLDLTTADERWRGPRRREVGDRALDARTDVYSTRPSADPC